MRAAGLYFAAEPPSSVQATTAYDMPAIGASLSMSEDGVWTVVHALAGTRINPGEIISHVAECDVQGASATQLQKLLDGEGPVMLNVKCPSGRIRRVQVEKGKKPHGRRPTVIADSHFREPHSLPFEHVVPSANNKILDLQALSGTHKALASADESNATNVHVCVCQYGMYVLTYADF
jgi:hypothetical protein